MIYRVQNKLRRLLAAAAARLRRRRRPAVAQVKGCMRNVIVVKPPDPMFKEALFILREDYFTGEELNRQELMLQAREAAQSYTASLIPPARRRISVLQILVVAAAGLAILRLMGVI